ncbi:fucose permease [Elusimicrobium posterum]|uniref:MFS transporter n=1 Tax=Elusimicrobium posterum TaxID=3116653 RepID=UPI003C73F9E7
MNKKVLPVLMVFFAMGFGDVVGPIVGLAKDTFNLSYATAQLLPLVGFIMFFLLSLPMGILQDRKGKKLVINIGLATATLGLIIPLCIGMYGKFVPNPESMSQFYFLMTAILLLCGGAAILQVAGNAVMKDVSDDGKFSGNLSLANGIKAIGSSLGFLVPPFAAKFLGLDWSVLFPIYCVLVIVTFIWFNSAGIEEKKQDAGGTASIASCFKLLFSNRYVLMMVLTIFLYVGAEVCVSSSTPMLLKEYFGFGVNALTVSWALFFLPILFGRLLGPVVLRYITPQKFFVITIAMAIVGVLCVFTKNYYLCLIGTFLVGAGYANTFPLAYSITVDSMPEKNNELAGLMVSAICGGALIPPVMGFVADRAGLVAAYVIPLICLVYIMFVALYNSKKAVAK